MSTGAPTTPSLRHPIRPLIARTGPEGHRQATWLELFFDLCFVVAIAALARAFHSDPTWEGAGIFVGLFVPLWWTWIGFTWFANTFDNDDVPYRAVVFGGMLAVVWLASSVESAAAGDGLAYALAYIVLQLLVAVLMVRARLHVPSHPDPGTHELVGGYTARQIVIIPLGLIPWVVSLAIDGPARYALWAAGLVIHVLGPIIAFRSFGSEQEWHVEEHHTDRARAAYGIAADRPLMAVTDLFHLDHIRERYGLFTIIVLGESVLAVSIGISEVGWNVAAMLTASLAFLAAVSIWWTYFDRSGRDALSNSFASSFVWGYGHLAIFAGIAALGVGTELMIEAAAGGAETTEHAAEEGAAAGAHHGPLPGTAIFAGGAAAFWIGMTVINLANLGFRLTNLGRWFMSARLALAVLLIVAALLEVPVLAFAALAGGLMLVLNASETAAVFRFQRERATKGATS